MSYHAWTGAAEHQTLGFMQTVPDTDRSVSMDTAIRRTLALNAMQGSDFDLVELYSCFPCVPKMARRVLGWPLDKPASVFGGLTFGGGPVANYMSHAVVSMVHRLRQEGRHGFLFANGGLATDNHCIVLSTEPIAAALSAVLNTYTADTGAKKPRGYAGSCALPT